MIFGEIVGLKLLDICLTCDENPPKKPHPGNLSLPGFEPGLAAWLARMLPPAPAVDAKNTQYKNHKIESIDIEISKFTKTQSQCPLNSENVKIPYFSRL